MAIVLNTYRKKQRLRFRFPQEKSFVITHDCTTAHVVWAKTVAVLLVDVLHHTAHACCGTLNTAQQLYIENW